MNQLIGEKLEILLFRAISGGDIDTIDSILSLFGEAARTEMFNDEKMFKKCLDCAIKAHRMEVYNFLIENHFQLDEHKAAVNF